MHYQPQLIVGLTWLQGDCVQSHMQMDRCIRVCESTDPDDEKRASCPSDQGGNVKRPQPRRNAAVWGCDRICSVCGSSLALSARPDDAPVHLSSDLIKYPIEPDSSLCLSIGGLVRGAALLVVCEGHKNAEGTITHLPQVWFGVGSLHVAGVIEAFLADAHRRDATCVAMDCCDWSVESRPRGVCLPTRSHGVSCKRASLNCWGN